MRTTLSLLALTLLLARGAAPVGAAETRSGTVESAGDARVTVSGRTFTIDRDTELLDRGGHRIAVKELVPGTPVDLDIDDDGNLVSVHATLVR
jgi:hypothetical protein